MVDSESGQSRDPKDPRGPESSLGFDFDWGPKVGGRMDLGHLEFLLVVGANRDLASCHGPPRWALRPFARMTPDDGVSSQGRCYEHSQEYRGKVCVSYEQRKHCEAESLERTTYTLFIRGGLNTVHAMWAGTFQPGHVTYA